MDNGAELKGIGNSSRLDITTTTIHSGPGILEAKGGVKMTRVRTTTQPSVMMDLFIQKVQYLRCW